MFHSINCQKSAVIPYFLFLLAYLGSGCATIISGTKQDLKIVTNPPGAQARINFEQKSTPAVFSLKRGLPYTVYLSKEGYEDSVVYIGKKLNPHVILDCIWGPFFLFPAVIDGLSDSAYSLDPDTISATLVPVAKGVGDEHP